MSVSRVHRLIRLINLMQGATPMSADELAADTGVSRRTLFRDLKLLEAAGVPYYSESGKGYRISQRYFLPPLNLTVSETLGLLLLGQMAAARPKQPLHRSGLSAIRKLISSVPEPIRSACGEMIADVEINPGPAETGDREEHVYSNLQKAIDEHRVCEIDYESLADGGRIEMRYWPYLLHFSERAWYVLGHSEYHNQVRMLKLNRIMNIEVTTKRFTTPSDFASKDMLGLAWRLIPEGKEYDIVLRFTPKVARNVYEVKWHETQQVDLLEDGRCELRFTVDGLNEIAWWVCGYANQVEVIKPKKLRKMVGKMLSDAAKQYD